MTTYGRIKQVVSVRLIPLFWHDEWLRNNFVIVTCWKIVLSFSLFMFELSGLGRLLMLKEVSSLAELRLL